METDDRRYLVVNLILKCVLSLALFGCIFKMPYDYYQAVRFLCLVGCGWLTYFEIERKQNYLFGTITASIAVLYNPGYEIILRREIWHPIDIGLSVLLAIWVYIDASSLTKMIEES